MYRLEVKRTNGNTWDVIHARSTSALAMEMKLRIRKEEQIRAGRQNEKVTWERQNKNNRQNDETYRADRAGNELRKEHPPIPTPEGFEFALATFNKYGNIERFRPDDEPFYYWISEI